MAKKETEPKVVLEREYNVPLRKGWLKVPRYKRATKAVKTLKEFLVKHMKVYDRDLRKIKVDINLNNEIRFRGMKKPPAKIKVKALKFDNGIVKAELVDIPQIIKFKRAKLDKKKKSVEKKVQEKKEEKIEEKKEEESEEKKEEAKEKEESAKEESMNLAKMQAKESKHVTKTKEVHIHRKALAK